MPPFIAGTVQDPISHQAAGDLQHAGTFQVFSVDAFDDFCLFGDDDKLIVFAAGVTQDSLAIYLNFALLVSVLQAHLHVLAQ